MKYSVDRLGRVLCGFLFLSGMLGCGRRETPAPPTQPPPAVPRAQENPDAPPSGKILKPDEFKQWVIKYGPTKVFMPRDLRFSRDGKYIVIAAGGGVEIRDGVTMQHLKVLDMDLLAEKGSGSGAFGADFSPDGKYVAFDWRVHKNSAITDDSRVVIVDWQAEKVEKTLQADSDITSVRYSPDGKRVVAIGNGRRGKKDLRIWNTETWAVEFDAHVSEGSLLDAEFSPDGKWFAAKGIGVELCVWDTTDWRARVWTEGGVASFGFDPSANLLVQSSRKVMEGEERVVYGKLRVADPQSLKVLSERDVRFCSDIVAAHPSGKHYANGHTSAVSISDLSGMAWYRFDTESGPATVSGIDFSPDGKRLAFVLGGTCILLNTDWLK